MPETTPTPEEQAKADNKEFSAGYDAVVNADPPQGEPAVTVSEKPAEGPVVIPAAEVEKPEEEEIFAGLTSSQLKGLLAKSAQVDELQGQIRKAYGKIGELNSTLQELAHREAPAPAAVTPAADTGPSEEDLETDYPDIARLADMRARKIVSDAMKGFKPTAGAPDAEAMAAQVESKVQFEVNRTLMGYAHPDWESVIASDDYKVWLATQPDETRERATTTPRAAELAEIVGSYKSWKGTSADKTARSRERLQAGITPTGVHGQTPTGPTEQDEFRAGFLSVRGK